MTTIQTIIYLLKLLVFGETWPIMVMFIGIIILASLRNCFSSRGSGQVMLRHGNGFFIMMSAAAGLFHFIDLIWAMLFNDFVIVRPNAAKNPQTASILLALFLGTFIGVMLFITSHTIRENLENKLEDDLMFRQLRRNSYR